VAGFLRDRVIGLAFGNTAQGLLGATMVVWALDKANEAKRGVTLDVAHVRPGETYTVTTRPAPGRKERKAEKRALELQRQLRRVEVSPRKVRAAEREVSAAARKLEKTHPGTRSAARRRKALAAGEQRLGALTTPSRKEARMRAELEVHLAEIDRRRSAALANARSRPRRPLVREFR